MTNTGSIQSLNREEHEADQLLDHGNVDNENEVADAQDDSQDGSKPVWGFYCYSWAVEVYVIVTLSLFLRW